MNELEQARREGESEGKLRERLHLAKMVERRVRRLQASAFAAAHPDEADLVIHEARTIAHALASSIHELERVRYYVDEHVSRRKYREHAAEKERGAGEQLALAFGPLVDVPPRFELAPLPPPREQPPKVAPRASVVDALLGRRRRPRIRWKREWLHDEIEYGAGYSREGGWQLMRLRHPGQRAVWFARKVEGPGGEVLVDLGLAYSVREAKERAQFHEDYDA
jgi:hypothetical protein